MEEASFQRDDSKEERSLLCFLCFNVLNPNSNDAAREQKGYKHGSKEFCFDKICKILNIGEEVIPWQDKNFGVFTIRLCLKCCRAGKNLSNLVEASKPKVTEAIRSFYGRVSLDFHESERMRSVCRVLYNFRMEIIKRCNNILTASFGLLLNFPPKISGDVGTSPRKRSLPAPNPASESLSIPKIAKACEGIKLEENPTIIETILTEFLKKCLDKLTVKTESPIKSEPSHFSGLDSSRRKRSLPTTTPTSESPSRPKIVAAVEGIKLEQKPTEDNIESPIKSEPSHSSGFSSSPRIPRLLPFHPASESLNKPKIGKAFDEIKLEEKPTEDQLCPSEVPKYIENLLSNLYTSTKFPDSDCNSVYSCQRCQDVFLSLEKIQHHIIFAHPEELFPNCKLKEIPDNLFQTTCQKLLVEILPNSFLLETGKNRNDTCTLCSILPGGGKARSASQENQTPLDHLFSEHYSNLVELLENMQKGDIEIMDPVEMPSPAKPHILACTKRVIRGFLLRKERLDSIIGNKK